MSPEQQRESTLLHRVRSLRLWPKDRHIGLLLAVVLITFVSLSTLRPDTFASGRNLTSMALQVSDLGVLALAMMLAMIIGGIDLSITATANLSAISSALVMAHLTASAVPGGPTTMIGVTVALGVGLLCGIVNGLLVGYAGVPAILATLATLTLFSGFATVLTGGVSIYGFPDELTAFGTAGIAYIPLPTLLFAVVAVVVFLLLTRTPLGLRMYLVGANPRATAFSGVRNGRVVLSTYIATGLLSAIAGVIVMARTDSANPNYGSSYILVTILVVVLGGVSVAGGSGRVSGVVIAVILLQLLSTGLNMLLVGVTSGSNFVRDLAWGAVLLIVLAVSGRSALRRPRRVKKATGAPTTEPRDSAPAEVSR